MDTHNGTTLEFNQHSLRILESRSTS